MMKTIKKCLAEVYFPDRHFHLTYFNDEFPLEVGDLVYVEGKMEGIAGRVEKISYNFKIRLSDYKRIIARIDTRVEGQFYLAGDSVITLEERALPYEKVRSWFIPPSKEEEETVVSTDLEEEYYSFDELKEKTPLAIWERGEEYYEEDRVVYAEFDGDMIRAIVLGTYAYEVEWEYDHGEIRNLLCNCFCTGTCKHEVAAMLQVTETMKAMDEEYGDDFDHRYIAMMPKSVFFKYTLATPKSGGFKLN